MPDTRSATAADAALISAHRRAMFAEVHTLDDAILTAIERRSVEWTERMIREGKYFGWIIAETGRPVASAGLLILDWPPHPFDPEGERRGYLLNVYVEPACRRRGLARELVKRCLTEAHSRGIRVVSLHSSDAARPIYESFSFRRTNEMLHVDGPEKKRS